MNWLEAYEGNSLVEMQQKSDKAGLAELVRRALANLDHLNSPELMSRRRAFALERTYYRHLEHMQSLVPLLADARSDAA
jgi:hypothetical protein